ncbi:MAG: ABC transporter permease subunit [Peptococcaceae bacterium]|jgi:ABC-2 type transport system permease protein|nr:ABC transporter permease subunit [Peptococcaceae bacterium]
MAVFRAALVNELEKLWKKRKALLAIILSFAVIVVGQLLVVGIRSGWGIRGVGSLEFPILVLSVVINTILPLFTALLAIDCFSGEFSNNAIRFSLTRPVSRFKIFSAKVAAIALFIMANLLLLLLLSSLAGFLFNANSASLASYFKTILAYLASFFPLFVLALGIILLANTLKSGTTVFFASVLIFLLFKGLGFVFPQFSILLPTSLLDWYHLWLANNFPLAKIVRGFLHLLGYAIIFFTAGYYFFEKKEF